MQMPRPETNARTEPQSRAPAQGTCVLGLLSAHPDPPSQNLLGPFHLPNCGHCGGLPLAHSNHFVSPRICPGANWLFL